MELVAIFWVGIICDTLAAWIGFLDSNFVCILFRMSVFDEGVWLRYYQTCENFIFGHGRVAGDARTFLFVWRIISDNYRWKKDVRDNLIWILFLRFIAKFIETHWFIKRLQWNFLDTRFSINTQEYKFKHEEWNSMTKIQLAICFNTLSSDRTLGYDELVDFDVAAISDSQSCIMTSKNDWVRMLTKLNAPFEEECVSIISV